LEQGDVECWFRVSLIIFTVFSSENKRDIRDSLKATELMTIEEKVKSFQVSDQYLFLLKKKNNNNNNT
jgi:hypothetical protein